jgi:hypothetical protein
MVIDHDNTPPGPAPPLEPDADDDGVERRITVRLDPYRYYLLGRLAASEGLAPTTMARVLLFRGLRSAERDLDSLDLAAGGHPDD